MHGGACVQIGLVIYFVLVPFEKILDAVAVDGRPGRKFDGTYGRKNIRQQSENFV